MRTALVSLMTAAMIAMVALVAVPNQVSAGGTPSMKAAVYPNPFTEGTTFQLTMPNAGVIEVSVFDILGRHIRTLIPKVLHKEGKYDVPWDGKDKVGVAVPPGTYVCVLFSEDVPVKSVKVIKVSK